MQKPRAVGLLPVCLTVKPVGEPDALIGHVRFDERGWETERCRMAQATAPILDSTVPEEPIRVGNVRSRESSRQGHRVLESTRLTLKGMRQDDFIQSPRRPVAGHPLRHVPSLSIAWFGILG